MKISILGCGWLGLPLAKELLAKSHCVKGSTTSPEKLQFLSSEGIIPFLLSVSSEGISGDLTGFLADSELLIINIPPGLRRNPEKDFAGAIERLVREIDTSGVQRVIFVSSTSVYPDTPEIPIYTEADAANGNSEAAKQLRSSEDLLLKHHSFSTCVLRFGGLIGADRHPVKFLTGRKNISNPLAPVNLIHRKDCVGIIMKLVAARNAAGIFNAVYPEHPSRRDYYIKRAQEEGLIPPEFNEASPSKGKIIRSERIGEELGYEFQMGIN